MTDSLVALIGLGVLAGGAIIVIDTLVVGKNRRLAATDRPDERNGAGRPERRGRSG